ncbi:MAG: hypothetical protein KF878_08595 [Planctomycetes bacterium]|nr:hypothetical protein [Planctomycetota bacterium]
MSDLACDRCGRSLLVFEDVRYEVVIRVTAAYDPLELDLDTIAKADVSAELERLARAVGKKTAQELEDEVWKELKFDLCGRCQREYLKDPLPRRPDP